MLCPKVATKGAVVLRFMNAKSPIDQHFLNATSTIGQKKSGSYCVQYQRVDFFV